MLTKKQRVAVAADVLKVLRMRKGYEIVRGRYFSVDYGSEARDVISAGETELQQLLDTKALAISDCKVCARGACVISKARLMNEVKLTGSYDLDEDIANESLTMFGAKLAGMIETAFEGDRGADTTDEMDYVSIKFPKLYAKCMAFATKAERATNPKRVLKRIMQNIVDNGGDFKP